MSSGGWNISAMVASALLAMSANAAPTEPVVSTPDPFVIPIASHEVLAEPMAAIPDESIALPPVPAVEHESIPVAESAGPMAEGGRVILALGAVLLLVLLTRAAVRRTAPSLGRSTDVLEVLARHPLGRGHALLVIRMFQRIVLVHHAGSTVTPISEISDEDEVAAVLRSLAVEVPATESDHAATFADVMRRITASRGGDSDDASDDAVEIVDLTRAQAGRRHARSRWGRAR